MARSRLVREAERLYAQVQREPLITEETLLGATNLADRGRRSLKRRLRAIPDDGSFESSVRRLKLGFDAMGIVAPLDEAIGKIDDQILAEKAYRHSQE